MHHSTFVSFEADWECTKERKWRLILQSDKKENAKQKDHMRQVDDEVMVQLDPNRKHGSDHCVRWSFARAALTHLNDNGTAQLRKTAANGGAVRQTWNVWNAIPRKA